MSQHKRTKRRFPMAAVLAVILILAGVATIAGSLWMQENEISTGAEGYKALGEQLHKIAYAQGSTLSPFDSYLMIRGIKTLALRMERQQQTALRIAKWLQTQKKVEKVYYVGLPDHPAYELNAKQSRGAGGMLSFAVDSHETALKLLQNVKVATFAESLGGPETLITLPALQTHRDVEESQRLRLGITDSLLRMSVGLENADDLIADLDQALNG